MKKIFCLMLAAACVLWCIGCTPAEQPAQQTDALPAQDAIALVLPQENEFYRKLVQAAEDAAQNSGFCIRTYYSTSVSAQEANLRSAAAHNAKLIVLDPIAPDGLDETVQACGTVYCMLHPVNAQTQTLFCPDYHEFGTQAAGMLAQQEANTLLVLPAEDDIVSTLMRDGFLQAAEESQNVSLADTVLFGSGTDAAYEAALRALEKNTGITAVFCTEDAVFGVLEAAEQTGRSIAVVTTGCGEDVTRLKAEGKILGSVYVDPEALAQDVVKTALAYLREDADVQTYYPVEVKTQ